MSQARVRGIERQVELASVAREAARRLGVEVEIADGPFDGEDPRELEAAYLFNPFTETIHLPGACDFAADRRAARAAADIAVAETFLASARLGMRVVTYCGFGGTVPTTYERIAREVWEGGALELWEKRTASGTESPSIASESEAQDDQ
jgi:hypothetical protein